MLGLVLLFTLLYKIMPVAKVSFRRALAGGLTAAMLWEITRHLLVAYYTKISMVNVLYGSMATIIIVLLTMEAVALILLLGAQVIADLQRNANLGIPGTRIRTTRHDRASHLTARDESPRVLCYGLDSHPRILPTCPQIGTAIGVKYA